INAEPRGIDDDLRKRRDIPQAHVEPLARDRMNDMRGIPDQRQPLADEGAGDEIGQRKGARLVEGLHLAEMQAEALFELAMKVLLVEGDDAGSFAARFGPNQRGAFSSQRQDREGTRGKKMLLGAALMITLVTNRDYDTGLIVIPAMRDDAGALAQFRARAVGGNQKTR